MVMMSTNSNYIDKLTGIPNRNYLITKQEPDIKQLIKKNIPFSIVWVDIDYFKTINDTYGHIKGDQVLREFAQFLRGSLRTMDTVIRYGGDEFVCVMPHTTKKDTIWVYRRIVRECKARLHSGLNITISVGISSFPDDGKFFEKLLEIADGMLYEAKRSGRDRVGTKQKKRAELPIKELIDRIEEKEGLRRLILDHKNRVKCAIVKGNVGIGKTRLVQEVLSQIRGREVIWANCLSLVNNIAYYPIREVLKYKIRRLGLDILKELPLSCKIEIGKFIPELMEEIKEEIKGFELVIDRYRLYDSIVALLGTCKNSKTIVIDNAQWIDRESCEVIKYVTRSTIDRSLVFIFIYRTEECTETLDECISFISREVETDEFELRPFKYPETTAAIRSIIGEDPEKHLVDLVIRESGGNPLFIEAIMRKLIDDKLLTIDSENWQLKIPENNIMPKTIEDILMRKYRGLSNEAQQILEIASVIGWFDIEIIRGITKYNENHIIGLMDSINKLGFTTFLRDRTEFSDELSRNVIYNKNVVGMKCVHLHNSVGQKLEERYKGKELEVVEELALHFYKGQDKERCVKYCVEAGDTAKKKYANRNALRYYSWALELFKKDQTQAGVEKKIDCLVAQAEVLSFIGDNKEALVNLNSAFEYADTIKDYSRIVIVKHKKAIVYKNLARCRDAIREANECIKICHSYGNTALIINLMSAIATANYRLGETKKASEQYEDALRMCKEQKNEKEISKISANLGNIYQDLGNYDRALQQYKASQAEFERTGDKVNASKTIGNIASLYTKIGDYEQALTLNKTAAHAFREIGDRNSESHSYLNSGYIHYVLGNYKEALKYYEESLRIKKDVQEKDSEVLLLILLGDVYINLGDNKRTKELYNEALSISKNLKIPKLICLSQMSISSYYLTINRIDKSKKWLDKAQGFHTSSKRILKTMSMLSCDIFLSEKNLIEFRKASAKLKKLLKESPKTQYGNFYLLMVRYYLQTRKFDKADVFAGKAAGVFDKTGERFNIGRTYYYKGILESEKGRTERSRELFGKAIDVFNSIGAKRWKKKTKEVLISS